MNTINIKNIILLLIGTICLSACKFQSADLNLDFAKGNKAELERVFDKYMLSGDTLKQRAVLFLLNNMRPHCSMSSANSAAFEAAVNKMDTIPPSDALDSLWQTLYKTEDGNPMWDGENISYNFLTNDIDYAFNIWSKNKWSKQIKFETFCKYILPYRFTQEPLEDGWREMLHTKYHCMTDSLSDVKEAFATVYRNLKDSLKGEEYLYHYPLKPTTMGKIMRGNCIQRCIYIGQVMRALGIPVAIDWIHNWANYSVNGHYWVSLVLEDGTYTLSEDGYTVMKYGPIDSSIFKVDFMPEEDYLFQPTFKKRCAKVFRSTYETVEHDMAEIFRDTPFAWQYEQNIKDVSLEYGYNNNVIIQRGDEGRIACLCTYITAKGWVPVSVVTADKGMYEFKNINDSIVYMFATFEDGKLQCHGNPFLLTAQGKKELNPDKVHRETATLYRKYPLIGRNISACAAMRGAVIEGSNSSDFKTAWTLYHIDRSPLFKNVYKSLSNKPCRYVRVVPQEGKKFPVAEIELWTGSKKRHAITYGNTYSKVEKAVDGNTMTATKNIMPLPDRMLQLDLGAMRTITRIVLYPANDDNYIVKGNTYELFYNDSGRWISLGKKLAKENRLVYGNVPTNALLLLHNLTKGKEERIFTYEANQQIWW